MNTQQTIPAQTEQHQTTRLNIDFSHRMPSPFFDIHCPHNLAAAVNQSIDRATGILHMLAGQYAEEDCRLNNGIMYNVIMAAIRETEDVNSIVNAFSDAAILKDAKQAKQNQQA
ncbi:MAG: hypothetical protein D4R63_04250 [Methylococcaceae bacterium]|nr:MAG: hypothetical protein D4R63_04250 [Methylococcaceae bacterium]